MGGNMFLLTEFLEGTTEIIVEGDDKKNLYIEGIYGSWR